MYPCIPVVATTARKMAFASARTVSDFISSMIPSVFAEATATLAGAVARRFVAHYVKEPMYMGASRRPLATLDPSTQHI